jgi:raffinose/stachyose/melibiose transport system permease protein/N-acetylglucosamine transport system permease protein
MARQGERSGQVSAGQYLTRRLAAAVPAGLANLFLYFWVLFTLFTVLWVVLASFKTNQQLFESVWSLPRGLNLQSYVKAWKISKMGSYFLNSVLLISVSTAGIVFVAAPAAYVLARVAFRGRQLVTNLFVSGMSIPQVLLLVPLFMLLRRLLLLDKLLGVGLVYVVVNLPFTIFMLISFFVTLPGELEEAAAIDGASAFRTFRSVMLPLAGPGLSTAFIINFIWNWKEYFWPLVLISSDAKKTVSLGLYGLQGSMQYSADWVGLFAGCVIVMLPTLALYLLMSRRIMSGMTLGALKG